MNNIFRAGLLAAAAMAVAVPGGSPASAQVPSSSAAGALISPSFAFEGGDTLVRLLADRQIERAGRVMDGVGALIPRNAMTGLSGAAADLVGASVWAGGGGNHIANSTPGADYRGDQFNGVVGGDYAPEPWLIVGLSVGGEGRDIRTFFNDGTLTGKGVSVAPYAIVRLDTNVFVDASFSYARLFNDIERNDFPFSSTVFGDYDSNRYVGTANLHGVWNIDNWRLGVQVGYLHVHQDDEAYIQTGDCGGDCPVPSKSTDLGQVRGGGRIGYAFGDFVPYVIGRVDYNVIRPTNFDAPVGERLGGFVGAGLRWNIARDVTGVVQGNTIVGREHQTNYGGYATLRFSW